MTFLQYIKTVIVLIKQIPIYFARNAQFCNLYVKSVLENGKLLSYSVKRCNTSWYKTTSSNKNKYLHELVCCLVKHIFILFLSVTSSYQNSFFGKKALKSFSYFCHNRLR